MKYFTNVPKMLGLAALALGLAANVCSAEETTLKLKTQKVGEAALVLSTDGSGLGDRTIRADDVYKDGKLVGTGAVDCVTNRVDPIQVLCEVSVMLDDGQITWQGIIAIPITGPFTLPVVGGTGAYAGARGQAELVEVSPTSDEITLTFVD